MKHVFPFFLFLLSAHFTHAQYFDQDFDGTDTTAAYSILISLDTTMDTNIWQVGPPQKVNFDTPFSIPNVLVTDTVAPYPVNDSSRFTFGTNPALYDLGILALQWTQRLDFSSDGDGGMVEISVDSGETWINAFENPAIYNFFGYEAANEGILSNGEMGFVGNDTLWRDIWLCFDLSYYSDFDTLLFRYSLYSNEETGTGDGWMIDNFSMHPTWFHTISENPQESYLEVYPNPSMDGRINIRARKQKSVHFIEQMTLTDQQGRVVRTYGKSPTKYWIDISDLPHGIYYLKIETNVQTETVKIFHGK